MVDFFKIIMLLIEGLYNPHPIPSEVLDSRDPALAFQQMIKDYGIDLKPKPYDPKLEDPKPKNRVITSSEAPQKKYTAKVHSYAGAKPTVDEGAEVDINRLTDTIGGFFGGAR